MHRDAITKLKVWKESKNRKPLIIRGARQVGKTWLMQAFGEECYRDVVTLNFDRDERLKEMFSSNISPKNLLPDIELLSGKKIDPENTLLIFDEVQAVPRALTSLKYFNEEAPGIPIVAAGSLLGVALHPGTSFPVGKVSFLDLFPMSFAEFTDATERLELLKTALSEDASRRRLFKDLLMGCVKEYLLVGGMPKAVADYAEHCDFGRVSDIQEEILSAYDQDISKHAPLSQVPRIRSVLESVPRQLSKENKKFFYGQIKNGARGKDYELALFWLSDCGLIHRINKLSDVTYPIKAYEDPTAFKIYLCDVGLLSRMAGLSADILLRGDGIFDEFKGALAEQYVLQELIASEWRPFYWSNEKGRSEVDFIVQSETDILPIEVKSGVNLKAKSLKFYMDKFRPRKAVRASAADYKVNPVEYPDGARAELIDAPLYAFLPELDGMNAAE
jgi:predicted AAA+ superfamily ATPase